MKVLIIGYGSIGRRHDEVLSTFVGIESIDIVTKQTLKSRVTFPSLEKVEVLEAYDYFIIASETYKHYEQLAYLELHVNDKLIFCEKPLFETYRQLDISQNRVYVGYVLRFHPLVQKMKTLLENEKIISVHAYCGQYLPTWRKEVDYKTTYSAKKAEGGGVLLDLSHEIDYIQWLFGTMREVQSYQLKISDLEIDSDDCVTCIAKTSHNVIVSVSMDYISKVTRREMMVHTVEHTYVLDFIANRLVQKNKDTQENIYTSDSLERNTMFLQMHQAILAQSSTACTYREAQDVMQTITMIQEQNR